MKSRQCKSAKLPDNKLRIKNKSNEKIKLKSNLITAAASFVVLLQDLVNDIVDLLLRELRPEKTKRQ